MASRLIITGFLFFLVVGVLGLLMRTQLIVPDSELLSPELYNQLFTMPGTVMMFVFAVPIMEAFGAYLVPSMMGTRDLAFRGSRPTAIGATCPAACCCCRASWSARRRTAAGSCTCR